MRSENRDYLIIAIERKVPQCARWSHLKGHVRLGTSGSTQTFLTDGWWCALTEQRLESPFPRKSQMSGYQQGCIDLEVIYNTCRPTPGHFTATGLAGEGSVLGKAPGDCPSCSSALLESRRPRSPAHSDLEGTLGTPQGSPNW